MTPRLTTPQLAVLRALDALPEGEWTTAKDGGFKATSANSLSVCFWGHPEKFVRRDFDHAFLGAVRFGITPAGRALVAQLKAEGVL